MLSLTENGGSSRIGKQLEYPPSGIKTIRLEERPILEDVYIISSSCNLSGV